VSTGLQTTFELLVRTPNEAAAGVLVPALDSPHQAIQEGALRTILQRRSPIGTREVLRRIERVGHAWANVLHEFRGRMSAALRDAVLGDDEAMCRNGCRAILWFGEYDLVPALVNAAEDAANPNADRAAATLLELAEQLYQELAGPRDYRDRRDPQLARRHVTGTLELSLGRYGRHKRPEIVEAALLLMSRDNAALKKILQHPHDGAYLAVLDALRRSPRPGVLRLLLSYLGDPHAPASALGVLGRRADPAFLKHLLRRVGREPSAVAARNLKRIANIGWLRDDLAPLDALDDQGQHAAVQVAVCSGMKRPEVFRVVAHLLRHGKAGGRRAAAAALAQFDGAEANELALAALDDPDPRVQARLHGQLRRRGIPGAINRLLQMIDSPHEIVREAVRQSLDELSFDRFLQTYQALDDDVRRDTARLVKKLDPRGAVAGLREELTHRARGRRLRGVEMCELLEMADDFKAPLLKLLRDDDHMIRVAAARALGQSDGPRVRRALNEALGDRSASAREAAEESLRRITARGELLVVEERRP
jgi:HEAT repeat protein